MFKTTTKSSVDESSRVARAKVGTEENRLTFIPENGVMLYAKDSKKLYIGDGITPGGILYTGDMSDNFIESLLSNADALQEIANAIVNMGDVFYDPDIDGGRF